MEGLTQLMRAIVNPVMGFFPSLFAALVVLCVGWLLAVAVQQILLRLLQAVKFDRLIKKTSFGGVLRRGGMRGSAAQWLSNLGYWLILTLTGLFALKALQFPGVAGVLEGFFELLPKLVPCVITLLLGILLASFLRALIRASGSNASFPYGQLLGQVIYVVIVVLAVILAFEKLELMTRTIKAVLCILMATLGLTFAISVGLGSKELVQRGLEKLWENWKKEQR
jgi:hypothetical protein